MTVTQSIVSTVVVLFLIWIVGGGIALSAIAARASKRRVSWPRGILAQFLSGLVVPFFGGVFFVGLLEVLPFPLAFCVIIVPILVGQTVVIYKLLMLNWKNSFVVCLSILFPNFWFLLQGNSLVLSGIPSQDLAYVTKANGEMKSVATALVDYSGKNGQLPKPENEEGGSVAVMKIPMDATVTADFYFEGPSRVPMSLVEEGFFSELPQDPFRRRDPGTYSYGAGPIQGATVSFVLTSWGPDETIHGVTSDCA